MGSVQWEPQDHDKAAGKTFALVFPYDFLDFSIRDEIGGKFKSLRKRG